MSTARRIVLMLLTSLPATFVQAEVRLPSIIGSYMVVQQGMKVPIWGWATPGEKVTVAMRDKTAATVTEEDGKWQVKIGPFEPGESCRMTITGTNEIELADILVGEVWLCGGQSNMATMLKGYADQEEIEKINDSEIRLFKVEQQSTDEPQEDCQGRWTLCDPTSAAEFSANGYYFGKHLHSQLKVPVGLIHDCVSGTPGEAWASPETIADRVYQEFVDSFRQNHPKWAEANDSYEQAVKAWRIATRQWNAGGRQGQKPQLSVPRPANTGHPRGRPSGLYNGMIVPVAPFALKGVIWWQGEGNQGRAYQYARLLSSIIEDWRQLWGQGDFVFISGQLQNTTTREHDEPVGGGGMPTMREAFLEVWRSVPNSGMAVACDIGDEDTHFRNKMESGRRLAMVALGVAYGREITYSGPLFESMEIDGDTVRLTFNDFGGRLKIQPHRDHSGFVIAGADRVWHWADDVRIDGDCVVVRSPEVEEPVAVRYGWHVNPCLSLFNEEGLPASPFRTDDWAR
jgi:sialate O-acetylesterase